MVAAGSTWAVRGPISLAPTPTHGRRTPFSSDTVKATSPFPLGQGRKARCSRLSSFSGPGVPVVHPRDVPQAGGGAAIPKRATLELSGKPKKHSPSFPDRGWHMTAVMPGPHFRDWATRNGVNALTTGDTCILYPDSLGRGREKQSGQPWPGSFRLVLSHRPSKRSRSGSIRIPTGIRWSGSADVEVPGWPSRAGLSVQSKSRRSRCP
ncbi:MAG: hypothetical protein Ct9H300mP1_07440 [Planctomycetaceae bacterium]|nr:MAG: hypothetical protein Ct9H300mP1_07440 [Planctomycetaceae bacterium]